VTVIFCVAESATTGTPGMGSREIESRTTPRMCPLSCPQEGNLNDPTRVCQLVLGGDGAVLE